MPKKKPEKAQDEGFWHEFEDTLEHLKTRTAIVVVTLDRVSGAIEIDSSLSTPAETWYALSRAEQEQQEVLSPTPPDMIDD